MRFWIGLLIAALVGVAFYYRYIVFDPLALLALICMFWLNHATAERQKKLGSMISSSHENVVANQKELLKRIEQLHSEVRRK